MGNYQCDGTPYVLGALDTFSVCYRKAPIDASAIDPFGQDTLLTMDVDKKPERAATSPAAGTVISWQERRRNEWQESFQPVQQEQTEMRELVQDDQNNVAENAEPTVVVGEVVSLLQGSKGIVRFVGKTGFSPGIFVGVELDKPTGLNDGSVRGRRYFTCEPHHGVFVKPHLVENFATSQPGAGGLDWFKDD